MADFNKTQTVNNVTTNVWNAAVGASTSNRTLTIPTNGKYLDRDIKITLNGIKASDITNLNAENIKSGVTILGITGTHAGETHGNIGFSNLSLTSTPGVGMSNGFIPIVTTAGVSPLLWANELTIPASKGFNKITLGSGSIVYNLKMDDGGQGSTIYNVSGQQGKIVIGDTSEDYQDLGELVINPRKTILNLHGGGTASINSGSSLSVLNVYGSVERLCGGGKVVVGSLAVGLGEMCVDGNISSIYGTGMALIEEGKSWGATGGIPGLQVEGTLYSLCGEGTVTMNENSPNLGSLKEFNIGDNCVINKFHGNGKIIIAGPEASSSTKHYNLGELEIPTNNYVLGCYGQGLLQIKRGESLSILNVAGTLSGLMGEGEVYIRPASYFVTNWTGKDTMTGLGKLTVGANAKLLELVVTGDIFNVHGAGNMTIGTNDGTEYIQDVTITAGSSIKRLHGNGSVTIGNSNDAGWLSEVTVLDNATIQDLHGNGKVTARNVTIEVPAGASVKVKSAKYTTIHTLSCNSSGTLSYS